MDYPHSRTTECWSFRAKTLGHVFDAGRFDQREPGRSDKDEDDCFDPARNGQRQALVHMQNRNQGQEVFKWFNKAKNGAFINSPCVLSAFSRVTEWPAREQSERPCPRPSSIAASRLRQTSAMDFRHFEMEQYPEFRADILTSRFHYCNSREYTRW